MRKRPAAWGFPVPAGRCALCHPRSLAARSRRCATVVTDMWRTDRGLEERFSAPLAPGRRRPTALGEQPCSPWRITLVTRRAGGGLREPLSSVEGGGLTAACLASAEVHPAALHQRSVPPPSCALWRWRR